MKLKSPLKGCLPVKGAGCLPTKGCCDPRHSPCDPGIVRPKLFDDSDLVRDVGRDMVRRGMITAEEYCKIVAADNAYREEAARHTLRPRKVNTQVITRKPGFEKYVCRDPITLESYGPHTFEFTTGSYTVRYNIESLVNYILCSKELKEPTTRQPFTDADLARMDHLAEAAGLQAPSLVAFAAVAAAERAEALGRRDVLDGTERCLGEAAAELLRAIEEAPLDAAGGAQVALVALLPQVRHLFLQLAGLDAAAARAALRDLRAVLVGPPNRPTSQRGGLLRTALRFLDELPAAAAAAAAERAAAAAADGEGPAEGGEEGAGGAAAAAAGGDEAGSEGAVAEEREASFADGA